MNNLFIICLKEEELKGKGNKLQKQLQIHKENSENRFTETSIKL